MITTMINLNNRIKIAILGSAKVGKTGEWLILIITFCGFYFSLDQRKEGRQLVTLTTLLANYMTTKDNVSLAG